ncbi:MAG: inositol monophosphatase [Spirochaetes bacterium]|uniref:Inositol-1-monophosphatase n=1 Tax=Candidatus Ornithospirochaeta stercoripullorum TaxID=2840899 RepID=A0A9D9DZB0_9SPIO|nr:inositol monophosphatase [Candidatus Ornithospirochaeta stercoripullorum]
MLQKELEKRFAKAKEIALSASSFLLSHEALRRSISIKAENDYVTTGDKECERLIITQLKEAFPDDGIYGEESGDLSAESAVKWIIDPIDGTVDFMASFPNYTISIAFKDEEGIALGVVMVPRQNEMFSAIRGQGAFLNGERIYTDEVTDLGKTLAILVPPHRHHEYLHEYIKKMEKFYQIVSDMRSIGSAALSLCYVASGRCSIYYEIALHIYDVAAGLLILSEAGGIYSLKERSDGSLSVAASSNKAYEKMIEVVDE